MLELACALLRRFTLQLNEGKNIKVHDIRVVKDIQRHMIHLEGNPFMITLVRDGDKRIFAYSDMGIFGLVKAVPDFMVRLLS